MGRVVVAVPRRLRPAGVVHGVSCGRGLNPPPVPPVRGPPPAHRGVPSRTGRFGVEDERGPLVRRCALRLLRGSAGPARRPAHQSRPGPAVEASPSRVRSSAARCAAAGVRAEPAPRPACPELACGREGCRGWRPGLVGERRPFSGHQAQATRPSTAPSNPVGGSGAELAQFPLILGPDTFGGLTQDEEDRPLSHASDDQERGRAKD